MKVKSKYPITEGWMTTTLQLPEPGHQMDRDRVIDTVMNGKPEDYELAEYRNMKTLVRVVYRKKQKAKVESK